MARIAFMTAMTMTPTSANTASHIVNTPTAERIRTTAFTTRLNVIFCFTIPSVRLAILTASDSLRRVVVHYDNVCRFYCGIGAESAHCNADIGSCEHRCIVHSVSDKDKTAASAVLFKELLDLRHLVGGEKSGMDLVDRKPGCNPVGNRLHVAGQHDGLLHSREDFSSLSASSEPVFMLSDIEM